MLSFEDMKQKYSSVDTVGKQLKQMADEAVQETFDNNIGAKQCFLYDYYHDDQADMEYGYDPFQSETKIPVKLKFIVKSYKSMAKDDPEYHIMFEPDVWNSMSCKPEWFVENYEKFGIEFPIGLMCDIPDDRGIYHRWIVQYHEEANQFPKFGVLKCNYRFQWIEKDGVYRHKRQMWGINVSQSSYTSGIYTDYKLTSYDNQDKFILPWNPISANLRHDTRLAISMLQKEPLTYKITKVDTTSPKGIITYTVKQDRFDSEHDYVQLDPEKKDFGDMYADYYASDVKVNINDFMNHIDNTSLTYDKYTLVIETAKNDKVKLGNYKILEAKIYDGNNKEVTGDFYELSPDSECIWSFKFNKEDPIEKGLVEVDDEYNSVELANKYKCRFRFTGDEQYLGKNLHVFCQLDELKAHVALDIVTL